MPVCLMRNMHAERAVLFTMILSFILSGRSEYTTKQENFCIILVLFVENFLLRVRNFVENGR